MNEDDVNVEQPADADQLNVDLRAESNESLADQPVDSELENIR